MWKVTVFCLVLGWAVAATWGEALLRREVRTLRAEAVAHDCARYDGLSGEWGWVMPDDPSGGGYVKSEKLPMKGGK